MQPYHRCMIRLIVGQHQMVTRLLRGRSTTGRLNSHNRHGYIIRSQANPAGSIIQVSIPYKSSKIGPGPQNLPFPADCIVQTTKTQDMSRNNLYEPPFHWHINYCKIVCRHRSLLGMNASAAGLIGAAKPKLTRNCHAKNGPG